MKVFGIAVLVAVAIMVAIVRYELRHPCLSWVKHHVHSDFYTTVDAEYATSIDLLGRPAGSVVGFHVTPHPAVDYDEDVCAVRK